MEDLHIPKPCHENWDKMTPNEQGKQCNKCVKTVFDVTNWSDQKIEKTYQNNGGSLCIHIPEERLPQIHQKTKRNWRYIIIVSFAAFWLFFKNNIVKAQNPSTATVKDKDSTHNIINMVLTGTVMDSLEAQNGVAHATIVVTKGKKIIGGGLTQSNGKFRLEIKDTLESSDRITLEILHISYETITRSFAPKDSIDTEVYLTESHICMKEAVILLEKYELDTSGKRKRITTIMLGGVTSMRGVVSGLNVQRSIKRPLLDEYDTKSYYNDEIERYNLGR